MLRDWLWMVVGTLAACAAGSLPVRAQLGFDRPGGDYASFSLRSADPAQCNTNFGIIFSCWDYIFRTANKDLTRPVAYGCPQMHVPESFLQQFFYPFILVARSLGSNTPRPQPAGDTAQ